MQSREVRGLWRESSEGISQPGRDAERTVGVRIPSHLLPECHTRTIADTHLMKFDTAEMTGATAAFCPDTAGAVCGWARLALDALAHLWVPPPTPRPSPYPTNTTTTGSKVRARDGGGGDFRGDR